tara:strand:- start:639 stop:1382 length:744 start_codon:yes stop_codon:yes gene_type:complete
MKKRVMIGTPMYGGMASHAYIGSLLRNFNILRDKNIAVDWNFLGNESLITRGRNFITDYFLKSESTHLMWIDSDIGFDSDAIYKLLHHDEDFVGAAYPKKMIDWERIRTSSILSTNQNNLRDHGASYVVNFLDNNRDTNKTNEKGLIEMRHMGTGFMMVTKKVFKKMRANCRQARAANFGQFANWYTEYFKTDVDKNDGVLQSEDWVFCNQWREVGGKIWLDPSIKLDHIGTYIYEGDIQQVGANIT